MRAELLLVAAAALLTGDQTDRAENRAGILYD